MFASTGEATGFNDMTSWEMRAVAMKMQELDELLARIAPGFTPWWNADGKWAETRDKLWMGAGEVSTASILDEYGVADFDQQNAWLYDRIGKMVTIVDTEGTGMVGELYAAPDNDGDEDSFIVLSQPGVKPRAMVSFTILDVGQVIELSREAKTRVLIVLNQGQCLSPAATITVCEKS